MTLKTHNTEPVGCECERSDNSVEAEPTSLAVEPEDRVEPLVDEEESGDEIIALPFEPKEIRIETRTMTVDLLIRRIKADEIDLCPNFQRAAGLWTVGAQSRLIESLLIRIPLPVFYMDATNDDHWLVVDGLQRLSALRRFVVDEVFGLTGLEFLTALTDKRFSELPRTMQRRIEETQVTVHLIQPGTPPDVKFNIFKRINTGGLPLSLQEIRHALYQGPAADLLQQLAALPEFVGVKGGSFQNERMADRECALRFLSFVLSPYAGYKAHSLDRFLSQQMQRLNGMSEIEQAELSARFKRAMTAAYELFGNDAFRKRYNPADRRKPINKALFESWSVGLDALSDEDLKTLVERRETLAQAFITLMNDPEFDSAISQGTGDPRKVERRFSEIARIIRETLT